MSIFEGKKKTTTLEQMMPDWQKQVGENLAGLINKYLPSYVPGQEYGKPLSAGATPEEDRSLQILNQYLGANPTGDLFGAGKQQIMDTLGGKYYNPETNPFIQSMTKLHGTNLLDQIDAMKRSQGVNNRYFTSNTMSNEGKLRENTLNTLNALIGQYGQNERQNMLNAVPQAAAMDEYENVTSPLKQVAAGQTFGSLYRTLQQADFERQYQDFIRQQTEKGNLMGAAQGLYGTNTQYGVKNWETQGQSPFMTGLNIASSIAGLINPAMSMGGTIFKGLSTAGGVLPKIF